MVDSREENERFLKLVESTFYKILERHPEYGTYLGLHEYDDKLSDGSRESVMEEIKMIAETRNMLLDIDYNLLSEDNKIDYRLFRMLLDEYDFYLSELQMWRKMPEAAEHIGESIFPLFSREYAPIEKRLRAINSRLELSLRYIDNTMRRVDMPVKIYVETDLITSRMLPFFLNNILTVGGPIVDSLYDVCERLSKKLEEYEEFLEGIMPTSSDKFWIGKENLQKILKLRGIELSVDEILNLGKSYLEDLKEKKKKILEKLGVSESELERSMREKAPRSVDELILLYRKNVEKCREFVKSSGFCSLPSNERIIVMPTPEYLRHLIPFAAYYPPPKFENTLEGIYLVTPPADPKDFGEHNEYSVDNTCVHEAYPGHHTQICWANIQSSLIRTLSNFPEFIEGWAHYCEEAVAELGLNSTAEHEYIRTKDMIWRAVRVIVDVKLACGEMNFDEAVKLLVEETGMSVENASSEVRRYIHTQGYALSYLLGKHMIKELRREIEEIMGENFSPRWFHDTVLQLGNLPVNILREVVTEKARELTKKR